MSERDDDTESSWDDRLRTKLTDDWKSAELIAAQLNAKQFTVLARLKDMMRRNLVERRIVKKKPTSVPKGKGKVGASIQTAEFRRMQIGAKKPD
jgi:DNA-binding HxlR family transcriptional regulator